MSWDLNEISAQLVSGLAAAELGFSWHEVIEGEATLPFGALGYLDGVKESTNYAGASEISLPLWLLVDRSNDRAAVQALHRACSFGVTGSVRSALRALSTTPAMPWYSIQIAGTSHYGTTEYGSASALAVRFDLKIHARNA
jgi:hypothetical protein